jgi:nucleoside-diphosphate-sugar epimerase
VKVLVMGGTQFNGLALVRELVAHGHEVTVLNRGVSPAPLPAGVRRLVADRTDAEAMRKVLGGLDFDCIQDVSAYRPEDAERMVELFRDRTGHYIFVSSTVIYAASDLLPIGEAHPLDRSERQNEYGRNKIAAEDLLFREHRERGFPATVVALSMVFGPNNILPDREQRMFARLLQGRPILIPGDGTTIAQVGHVEDQARALRLMMGQSSTCGRRYNLTGGDYFSAEGYVDTFAATLGVEAEKVFIPAPLMEDVFTGRQAIQPVAIQSRADTRTRAAPDPRALNQFLCSMLVQRIAPHIHHWNRNVVFAIDRLREDVGWTPEIAFPEAVSRTFAWYREQGLDRSQSFDFSFEDALLERVRAG